MAKTKVSSFPFVWIPNTQKLDMSKIENPLAVSKDKVKPKTMKELVEELEQYPGIMDIIDFMLANNKFVDATKIGEIKYAPIGKNTFNSVVQRMYDYKHGSDILNNFDERLLVPIMATQLPNGDFSCIDTMHGSGLVGLLAKYGLWGNDPTDWENFEYPYFVINEPDPAFAPEAALSRNGKGQKKWKKFDYHRVYVFMVRHFGSTNKIYIDAEKRQQLCEKYECYPLSEKHPHASKAGTQTHIDALYSRPLKTTEFVLKTHKNYWHGTKLDNAAWGLYGNLFDSLTYLAIPTKGTDFEKFMDDCNAVIKECFTSLAGLRIAAENAHSEWYKACYDRKSKVAAKDDVALAIVLKIYQKLGGKHLVPGAAMAYSYNKGQNKHGNNVIVDIVDFLEPEVLQTIEDAIN